jgi:hypothetical protein
MEEPPQDKEFQIDCIKALVKDWTPWNQHFLIRELMKIAHINTYYNVSMPAVLTEFDIGENSITESEVAESIRKHAFLDWICDIFPEMSDVVTTDFLETCYEVFQFVAYRTSGTDTHITEYPDEDEITIYADCAKSTRAYSWSDPQFRDDFFWKQIFEEKSPAEVVLFCRNPPYYKCQWIAIPFNYLGMAILSSPPNSLDVFVLLDILGYFADHTYLTNTESDGSPSVKEHRRILDAVSQKFLSLDKDGLKTRRIELETAHIFPQDPSDPDVHQNPNEVPLRSLKYHFIDLRYRF